MPKLAEKSVMAVSKGAEQQKSFLPSLCQDWKNQVMSFWQSRRKGIQRAEGGFYEA